MLRSLFNTTATNSNQHLPPKAAQETAMARRRWITKNGECMFFLMIGIAVTALAPMFFCYEGNACRKHELHRKHGRLLSVPHQPISGQSSTAPARSVQIQNPQPHSPQPTPHITEQRGGMNNASNESSESLWNDIREQAEKAETSILKFFHGEVRALEDGVPFGGTEKSVSILASRLASRIHQCHRQRKDMNKGQRNDSNNNARNADDQEEGKECVLRCVFVGSGQMTGRDIFHNQSFPFQTEERLRAITSAAGIRLEVLNQANDSDLSREGPQTAHMCMKNLAGNNAVDVLVWDFEGTMQGRPQAQVEAFVRWVLAGLQPSPAMILFNRPGPHTHARRGTKRIVVNLVGTHDAILWEDNNPEDMPQIRQEPYRNSSTYKELWDSDRNYFWQPIMQRYAPFVDFAAIDPQGSIWHLDHLHEFSNTALDEGKALPLFDCPSPPHPPPCDQVPDVIHRHLARANMSIDTLPRHDTAGALCGVMWGCRHAWYGGPRSHAVRAALNALPIVRAFHQTAKILEHLAFEDHETVMTNEFSHHQHAKSASMTTLPDPAFCSKNVCSHVPSCLTSYLPNLGGDLSKAIIANETSPVAKPRLGACHYAHNPSFAVQNLNTRFAPLGYVDRKYALRLAADDGKPRGKKDNDQGVDASSTAIVFSMTGPGQVVLCEPPCFITSECSPKRKMPLVNHVSMELDGRPLPVPNGAPSQIEVGGKFCRIIAKSVGVGKHILRLTTSAVYPDHVMFSHLVSFS